MRTLVVLQNVHVSDTKQTSAQTSLFHLLQRVNSSHQLRAITSPSKMNQLRDVEHVPSVIIKPRLAPVTHTDDISLTKTFIYLGQDLSWIVSSLDALPRRITQWTTDCSPSNCVSETYSCKRLSSFYFLFIQFQYTFSVSYKILSYYFYYYCVLTR